jgi:hypothetical protein
MDAWVRETVLNEKPLFDRCGRPRSSFYRHPLVVVSLVQALIEREQASSTEGALHRLAALEYGSYDTLKSSYYQAKKEMRFQSLLQEYPATAWMVSARDLARVKVLQPGEHVTYTGDDPLLAELVVRYTD